MSHDPFLDLVYWHCHWIIGGINLDGNSLMTDLTDRLDRHLLNDDAEQRWLDGDNLIEEALAEIQRLREEVRRLRVEAGYD